MTAARKGEVHRKTGETDIELYLNVDGTGQAQIETGVPFLDHMLTLLAVHSLCDLRLKAQGDLAVDDHHTVEDIGICLGEAFKQALEHKQGICRYGEATIPMDEALARVVLDFSGRAYLYYQVEVEKEQIGTLAVESVREFFRALSCHAGMNLHIDLLRGVNAHHCLEVVFKAFAHAVRKAVAYESRLQGIWSSKGTLA